MGTTNFDSVSLGGDLTVAGTITGNVDITSTLKFGDGEAIVDTSGNEEIVFGVTASAVNEIKVTNAATGNAPEIAAQGGDTNVGLVLKGKGTGAITLGSITSSGVRLLGDQPIVDSSSNEYIKFSKTASAVNEITVINAATGGAPELNATGGDTDVSLKIAGKGAGSVMLRSTVLYKQGAPAAKTTSTTLTAAEIASGLLTVNQGAAGASALQLPLATDVDTLIPLSAANDSFVFSLINISTVAAEDASITTNTGWTLVGNMDVASNAAATDKSVGRFLARKTGAGAWTLYRIA